MSTLSWYKTDENVTHLKSCAILGLCCSDSNLSPVVWRCPLNSIKPVCVCAIVLFLLSKLTGFGRFWWGNGVTYSLYGCFLKWWYPQNTQKWTFLVGKTHGCWGTTILGNPHIICIILWTEWNLFLWDAGPRLLLQGRAKCLSSDPVHCNIASGKTPVDSRKTPAPPVI